MIAVTVTFQIHEGQIEAFLPLMVENARLSREVEPGCQFFDVCRDGSEVFLYELYDDRDAFAAHLEMAHFKSFDAAVADMVADKPVRIFDEVLR